MSIPPPSIPPPSNPQPTTTFPPKPSNKVSVPRWIIFLLTFFSMLTFISSSIMKNVQEWFNETKTKLTFQFSCGDAVYTNPQTLPTTAKSPYVSQLSKNKCYQYDLGLADFYYFGAAKAYQLGGTSGSIPSYDVIADVLKRGARALEFDIFSDTADATKAVIRGEKPTIFETDNYLEVDQAFDKVNASAWSDPFKDYPLLLYLNLHTGNKDLLDTLASTFKTKFASRLLDIKYGAAAILPEYILMKDCLSKIVLIVNSTNSGMEISETQPMTTSVDFDSCINCFFCSNKDPSKSANEIIELAMSSDIDVQTAYNKSMNSSDLLNLSDLMNNNREHMAISRPTLKFMSGDFTNQTDDLQSYDIVPAQTHGCQINLYHFNLVDDNLNRAFIMFKNGPIQLRPQYLRNMPQEGVDIVEANVNTAFTEQTIDVDYQGANFNQNSIF